MDPNKRIARLLEITRALSTAGDMDKYLQSLVSAAIELTNSETASILQYDEGSAGLRYSVVPWFHRDTILGVKVPVNGTASGSVFTEGKPVILREVDPHNRHQRQIERLSKFKIRSLIAVPVLLRERPLGVFEALNKADPGLYTEEDLAILDTLAALASLAIRHKQLEHRVEDSSHEMNELDRLKNEFIAITSHELRTPLGLILGHATFLREMLGTQYNEQLDAIIRNASRLKEIIETLSNFDNYQTGAARLRHRKVSMTNIVEEVVSSFEEMAKQKGVRLKKQLNKQDLLVDADGAKIAIALSNLVKNAITFTDKDGQVLVKAETDPGYIKVSVIDNGVGIPARDMPRIFERFFQVESHLTRRHGGMGLGLAVAKMMVEMHGGRIWAESVEGKGSNFTFLLPLETQTAAPVVKPFHT